MKSSNGNLSCMKSGTGNPSCMKIGNGYTSSVDHGYGNANNNLNVVYAESSPWSRSDLLEGLS